MSNFISNDLKNIKLRLKLFEYLKLNIHYKGFFSKNTLIETRWKRWKNDFKDSLFFSRSSTNSCGVAIGFCKSYSLHIIGRKSDENGRLFVIDAKVNEKKFLQVNLYNLNTESEQIKMLDTLKKLLEDIDNKI